MLRTGSGEKLIGPGKPEQQPKDLERLLVQAEQKIRKLQQKVTDQKQQIRALQTQAKQDDRLAAEREELKAEIAELRSETRELTRANREHVERAEILRVENARLRAEMKGRKPNGMKAGTSSRAMLEPSLS